MNQGNPKDRRFAATLTLAVSTFFMFAMSVMPLVQSVEQGGAVDLMMAGGSLVLIFGLLPALVLLSSGVGMYAIWRFGTPVSPQLPDETIKQIQERLVNLETIISYEEKALRTKIDRLRSGLDG